MLRLKVFGVALVALFVVGVMTAGAAFAESTPLPQIHTALEKENYPLNLLGQKTAESEGQIALENTTSELPAGTISVLLALSELGSLGTALVLFTEVHEEAAVGGTKCNTTGDAPGVVLVPETQWHLVYTSLSPSSVLETAGLILVPKFTITCGALLTTTEGSNLGKFIETPGNSANGGDSTQIESVTRCSKPAGTQEVSSYFNDNLEELTKQLLKANISGLGNENSCEEVAGTLLLEVEPGSNASMFTVLL